MRLVQVAQRATDLDRAAAFYSLLLGAAPTGRFDPPGLLFFDLDGTRLLLDVNAPSALLYLRVDDVAATLRRLSDAGVEVVSEPHLIFTHADDSLGPSGAQEWQAFVRDCEDNLVGLVEWRRPDPPVDPASNRSRGPGH
ncbi:MAG: VOC family protein [Micropruina sp.]|nr:VOC family protein [Micropruina sp.]